LIEAVLNLYGGEGPAANGVCRHYAEEL
jgi:hypothetical protein